MRNDMHIKFMQVAVAFTPRTLASPALVRLIIAPKTIKSHHYAHHHPNGSPEREEKRARSSTTTVQGP